MPKKKQQLSGFTLLEVLMVIIVIGVLATMASTSLIAVRSKASDVKRLADIRQIQYALDRFAEDNGNYPSATQFIPGGSLVDPINSRVYLERIPNNPVPKIGGDCPDEYSYVQGDSGRSYTLTYCLGNKVSDLFPGQCVAMPGIICSQNTNCSCDDMNKNCCGYCNVGSQCGGGVLFAKNFQVDVNNSFDLVVDGLATEGHGTYAYDTAIPWVVSGATSRDDGNFNTSQLSDARYAAAKACSDFSIYNKDDWYLPSVNEAKTLCSSGLINPWSGRLTSTEISLDLIGEVISNNCADISWPKMAVLPINCVRRAP